MLPIRYIDWALITARGTKIGHERMLGVNASKIICHDLLYCEFRTIDAVHVARIRSVSLKF